MWKTFLFSWLTVTFQNAVLFCFFYNKDLKCNHAKTNHDADKMQKKKKKINSLILLDHPNNDVH